MAESPFSTASAGRSVYTYQENCEGGKQMRRRLGCILMVLFLLCGMKITAAAAVETGSITVDWGCSTGSVTLYKVGSPISGGYMLRREFGGGIITDRDVSSEALAQWLWEHAEYEGWILPADERGRAEYQRLEEGLYLLVQNRAADGYYPFSPFLVELPYEGQWHLQANPKMEQYPTEQPRTGQGLEPIPGILGVIFSGAGLAVCFFKRSKNW